MNRRIKLAELLFPIKHWSLFKLLAEDKISDYRKQLSDPKEFEYYDEVTSIEPKLPPKFLQWLTKTWIPNAIGKRSDAQQNYNPDYIHGILMKFDKLANTNQITNKDINSEEYKKYGGIYLTTAVEEKWRAYSQQKQTQEEHKRAIKSTPTIYEDNKWLIVAPENEPASCHFGRDTKWCISATESENHFNNYYNAGIRFVVIIDKEKAKRDPYSKIAVAYVGGKTTLSTQPLLESEYEIFNSEDTKIDIEVLRQIIPANIFMTINKYLKQDLLPATLEDEISKITNKTPYEFASQVIEWLKISTTEKHTVEARKAALEKAKRLLERGSVAQMAEATYEMMGGTGRQVLYELMQAGIDLLPDLIAKKLNNWNDLVLFMDQLDEHKDERGGSYFESDWIGLLQENSNLRNKLAEILKTTPEKDFISLYNIKKLEIDTQKKAYNYVAGDSPFIPSATVVDSLIRNMLNTKLGERIGFKKDEKIIPINLNGSSEVIIRDAFSYIKEFLNDEALNAVFREKNNGVEPTPMEKLKQKWSLALIGVKKFLSTTPYRDIVQNISKNSEKPEPLMRALINAANLSEEELDSYKIENYLKHNQ